MVNPTTYDAIVIGCGPGGCSAATFLAQVGKKVLAGEVEPSWPLRWRLEYFFLLIKLQSRWPLVPHISLELGETAKPSGSSAVGKA